jgi:hypothetical protein
MTLQPAEIPVFPAGYAPSATDFDGWVQAPFAFLTSLIVFRAEQHTAQAISANTHTTITYDTVLEDPYAGWSATNHRWTAPFTGWYSITVTAETATPSGTMDLAAAISISGIVRYQLSSTVVSTHAAGDCVAFTAAMVGGSDYAAGEVWASLATTLNSTAGKYSALEIIFVSE